MLKCANEYYYWCLSKCDYRNPLKDECWWMFHFATEWAFTSSPKSSTSTPEPRKQAIFFSTCSFWISILSQATGCYLANQEKKRKKPYQKALSLPTPCMAQHESLPFRGLVVCYSLSLSFLPPLFFPGLSPLTNLFLAASQAPYDPVKSLLYSLELHSIFSFKISFSLLCIDVLIYHLLCRYSVWRPLQRMFSDTFGNDKKIAWNSHSTKSNIFSRF